MMKIFERMFAEKNLVSRKPYGHETPAVISHIHSDIEVIMGEWKKFLHSTSSNGKPIDDFSKDQKHLNEDKKWKAFFIYVHGEFNPEIDVHFPLTHQLIRQWKNDFNLVFFSSLEPGKHIPAHKGNNHGVIRSQIGIDIADPGNTGLRVENKTVQLKEKELFIFDDTFEHEAWNFGEKLRTVLIIDSYKKMPYIYNKINRVLQKRLIHTEYVQSALKNWKR